jgi:hypothetical protein
MMTKSVVLPIGPDAAFALFTEHAGEWWPPERRHTDDPQSQILILPSGRFFERARDGREVDLGQVRTWNPPRLILLDFFIATGPERPTEVEIAFEPAGQGVEVTVTHRPKPSSQDLWDARAPRYAESWDRVLAALARAA